MPVDRCVCLNVTFAQLKDDAKVNCRTFDDLRSRYGCGSACSLCVPYIKAMLITGQTSFPADLPTIAQHREGLL